MERIALYIIKPTTVAVAAVDSRVPAAKGKVNLKYKASSMQTKRWTKIERFQRFSKFTH
jgi:hypothetical protein